MKKGYTKDKVSSILFRMSGEDKTKIEANASKYGFSNLSDYIRVVALNATFNVDVNEV
jgi:hypothetical protein